MQWDVVKDYDWTSSPRGSGIRKNAPSVTLRSYKLKSNQIMQAIQGFIALSDGINDADQFYEELYAKSTTLEDSFKLPFFTDSVRSFNNQFGDTFQSGIGGQGGAGSGLYEGGKTFVGGAADIYNIEDVGSLNESFWGLINGYNSGGWKGLGEAAKNINIGGSPGTYVETPMFYQYEKHDGPLEVSFVLSNTINSDSIENNQKLIKKLTKINKPLRKSSISVEPPRIYSVKVPGHRFIRWAYCESFSVDLMGTRREINNVIVPEAYKISMSFKSLTLEHAGFVDKS